MKNILLMIILMIALSNSSGARTLASIEPIPLTDSGTTITASASSSIETTIPELTEREKSNFFLKNWGTLLMSLLTFADVVARLTPTEKDNSILNLLSTIINAIIPNLKKGGGSFKLESK